MHGRWPAVKDFCVVVDCAWFSGKSEDLSSATVDDTIWSILQVNPSSLLKTTILEGATRQIVPSWSAFNAILYPDIPCTTNIGYCPLLDDSLTEFSQYSQYCHEAWPANKTESWTVGSCDYIYIQLYCKSRPREFNSSFLPSFPTHCCALEAFTSR